MLGPTGDENTDRINDLMLKNLQTTNDSPSHIFILVIIIASSFLFGLLFL